MKKILLVDDDPLVLELYRKKLAQGGFEVHTAADGLEAVKLLSALVPDFIVLDLMMPKLSGADVLKFIRSKPTLTKVPVAALTNAFMTDQARAMNGLGLERAIIKGDCTPAKMLELVNQILELPATPLPSSGETVLLNNEARESFLRDAPAEITDLRSVSLEFAQDPAAANRSGLLEEFCRQTHHLAGAAALAKCQPIALLGGALEALLFELGEKPQFINPSTTRTVSAAVEFLGVLIDSAQSGRRVDLGAGEVLAVDDDPLANRIALAALHRAKLNARAVESPVTALDLLAKQPFDLILMDVEMPEMSGYELCRKVRALPGYEAVPIIYVTSHSDFESRARSIGVGGHDLIAKPIFPIELAVKSVLHLVRGKLSLPAITTT